MDARNWTSRGVGGSDYYDARNWKSRGGGGSDYYDDDSLLSHSLQLTKQVK